MSEKRNIYDDTVGILTRGGLSVQSAELVDGGMLVTAPAADAGLAQEFGLRTLPPDGHVTRAFIREEECVDLVRDLFSSTTEDAGGAEDGGLSVESALELMREHDPEACQLIEEISSQSLEDIARGLADAAQEDDDDTVQRAALNLLGAATGKTRGSTDKAETKKRNAASSSIRSVQSKAGGNPLPGGDRPPVESRLGLGAIATATGLNTLKGRGVSGRS